MTEGVESYLAEPPAGRVPGRALCEKCRKLPPASSPERARLHVRATGHTVRYVVEQVWIYLPAPRVARMGSPE